MLDFVKPDPVTGEVINGAASRAYVATQTQLITDYSVASRVAEQVGWLTDPRLIAAYRARPKDDERDFRRWLADIVIGSTKAKLVEGSNILEISYTGSTAAGAKSVADALLKAYMDSTLEYKHESAERDAAWYANQTLKSKQALDQAVAAETDFERANGVVMQNDKIDAEDARLQSLNLETAPTTAPASVAASTEGSSASVQLSNIEAQITTSEKILGPNNPEILDLQAKKAALSALIQREKAAARSGGPISSGGAGALAQEVAAQKAKVIADSEKINRLYQLHQEVELRRDEYNHAAAKTAEYRQEANSADIGVTPLGTAATPKQPIFPNYLLIVPGSIILGLGVGIIVSLLMELFARRVRSTGDLTFDDDVPMICLVPGLEKPTNRRLRGWRIWRPTTRGAVGA